MNLTVILVRCTNNFTPVFLWIQSNFGNNVIIKVKQWRKFHFESTSQYNNLLLDSTQNLSFSLKTGSLVTQVKKKSTMPFKMYFFFDAFFFSFESKIRLMAFLFVKSFLTVHTFRQKKNFNVNPAKKLWPNLSSVKYSKFLGLFFWKNYGHSWTLTMESQANKVCELSPKKNKLNLI